MAITGYTKTEQNPTTTKAAKTGWLIIDTNVNQATKYNTYNTSNNSIHYKRYTPSSQRYYLHIEEPTEPAGDGTVDTAVFDDSETEYSGGPGFFKYWTSEAGIFTSNQNFGETETQWTLYHNSKCANITSGYTPYIRFYFYKRDGDDTDTELFYVETSVSTLYSLTGYSFSFYASGSVATTDRLRVGVYIGESAPA